MRTTKWFALLSAAAWIGVACADDISAPGSCPEFCPDADIIVVDTVLTNVVERDSSYFGYVLSHTGSEMPITHPGSAVRSLATVEFLRFAGTIANATTGLPIGLASVDSFHVTVRLLSRSAMNGLELVAHRIPPGLDSTTSYDTLLPFFHDSTIAGTLMIDDSLEQDTVRISIPRSQFPNYDTDSNRVALAFAVRGGPNAFASIQATEGGTGVLIRRFVTDTVGIQRSDTRGTEFDSFLRSASPTRPADVLVAGEAPTARTLLRFNLPPSIIDSATVVGAKLFLIPVGGVLGATGDTIQVQANGLSADFGAKSPIVLIVSSGGADSTGGVPTANIPVGSTDTVTIDVTALLRNWQNTEDRPHSIVIRVSPEGASNGTFYFGGSGHPTAAPVLSITYVTPFRFEG
jgi:hypothetical protein